MIFKIDIVGYLCFWYVVSYFIGISLIWILLLYLNFDIIVVKISLMIDNSIKFRVCFSFVIIIKSSICDWILYWDVVFSFSFFLLDFCG